MSVYFVYLFGCLQRKNGANLIQMWILAYFFSRSSILRFNSRPGAWDAKKHSSEQHRFIRKAQVSQKSTYFSEKHIAHKHLPEKQTGKLQHSKQVKTPRQYLDGQNFEKRTEREIDNLSLLASLY